ncbi:ML2 [Symbiodinium sp. CCMP2592]|nr:ML2 [Symbiodinium sp. CCMP2592]
MLVANQPVTSPACSVFRVQACSATSSGSAIRQRGLQISRSAAGVAAFGALQVVSFRRRQASVVQRPAQEGKRSQSSSATCATACVVVCGIPGSGKSTLCRLLCAAFENSMWLNQDHFPSGPRAKVQFLRGVRNSLDAAMRSRRSALVCVDKVNVQKAQSKPWRAMQERGGITIFCELCELSSPGNLLRRNLASASAAMPTTHSRRSSKRDETRRSVWPASFETRLRAGIESVCLNGVRPPTYFRLINVEERSTFWGQPGPFRLSSVTISSVGVMFTGLNIGSRCVTAELGSKRQSAGLRIGDNSAAVSVGRPGQVAQPASPASPASHLLTYAKETPPETAASETWLGRRFQLLDVLIRGAKLLCARQQSDPEAIIRDSWAEKVLQQLSKEAGFTKTLPHRDGVDISPSEIAALFGFDLLHGSEAQPLVKQQMRKGMPSIPKLDLTRVTRDEDEDDEDFENKAATLPPSNGASGSEIAWEQEQHSAHKMRQASSNQHGKSGNITTKSSMSGIKVSTNMQDTDKPKPYERLQTWSTHPAEEVCGAGHSGVARF